MIMNNHDDDYVYSDDDKQNPNIFNNYKFIDDTNFFSKIKSENKLFSFFATSNPLIFPSIVPNIQSLPLEDKKKVNHKKEIDQEPLYNTLIYSSNNTNNTNNTNKIITPKKKKQSIPKHIKKLVWNTYIGNDIIKHRCLCCKKITIENTFFECGHVISEKDGGSLEISNLRPICSECNRSMGSMNMVEYVKKFGLFIG